MSSRNKSPDPSRRRGAPRSGGLRPEPDVASPSGGHLAPDVQTTSPLLDPVHDTEVAPVHEPGLPEPRAIPGWSSADPIPAAPERRPASSTARRRTSRGRRATVRRVKRTLRHIDPLSVLKLSLFFYAVFVVVWMVIVAILYGIVDSMGLFDLIESFSESFALTWEVNIDLWYVERWALLMGIMLAVIGSLVNVVLSFLYNVAADMIGGIEMTYVERDV
jgi:hypothetical protein